MAVVAKVTIYDDETGEVFSKDKIIYPTKKTESRDLPVVITEFAFKVRCAGLDEEVKADVS